MIFYTRQHLDDDFFPEAALSDIAGKPVRLAHDKRGFRVVLPDGSDPVAGEPDAWASYSSGPQPTLEAVRAWRPPQPEPAPPVTDVNSPIKAILTGYQESEAARAQRIALLKSSASYALGAKIGAELAAANPPTNAEELAALKAEAKSQASTMGGVFFDKYFNWIGAYREGGGPGFLAAVQADTSAAFLDWPTPPNGITLPDGTIVLAEGGVVRDLFTHFLS